MCFVVLASIFGVGLVSIITALYVTPPPEKLLGVYSQPRWNYYIKIFFFYLLIQLRRWQGNRKNATEKHSAGYGVKSRVNEEEMECPQPLSDHPKAIDAVYFNAADQEGTYLVLATARRPRGVINGFFYLRIPEIGLLEMPRMPDTLLFGDGKSFSAEGLTVTPLEPMKAWKLEYTGKMKKRDDPLKTFEVKLDAMWTSNLGYFDFDIDFNPWALSKSMAREEWTRKYFQDLKSAHQTHYEQMGMIRGSVTVNGTSFILRMNSMRDHSYGHKREWKLMHRYGLHMIHTEDGYSMTVGIVCQPITCSNLELGYVFSPSGEKNAVSSVNLPLWQHGEGGTPPIDYAFSFTANGKEYFVEVQVIETSEIYIGWEWETRIVERMATYKVNGRRGWGIAEWDYRHNGGRPEEYTKNDPAWTQTLNKG